MDLGLDGTVAVVTGASKGIGLAITRALVAEGVYVVAGARESSEHLEELADQGDVRPILVDLATVTGPVDLVNAALDRGRLDILVNNVGQVSPRLNGFLMVTDDQWMHSINLNLMAAVRTTRAALPAMLAAGHGSIVTTSSVNAFLPDPGVIDYSAAKAALTKLQQGPLQRSGISRRPGQHRQPRTRGNRPLAGRRRGSSRSRPSQWPGPRHCRPGSGRPIRHRTLHSPGRSGSSRSHTHQRPDSGQHHRVRLRHRRRTHHTNLILNQVSPSHPHRTQQACSLTMVPFTHKDAPCWRWPRLW